MTQIVIIEDSSRYDLGGGQRITLETISCLQSEAKNNISLYDVGCGNEFRSEVLQKNISSNFFNLKSTSRFFYRLPSMVAVILKSLDASAKIILYPTTTKALILAVVVKMFKKETAIVFHQHYKPAKVFSWLKFFVSTVIIPGAIEDYYDKKTIVITNPIQITKSKQQCNEIQPDKITLGFIGSLSSHKGFDMFLGYQKTNTLNALVAGTGPLKDTTSNNIHYLDYITGQNKGRFYTDIDVLVFPSRVEETFSLVCFEALFNYNPVVCFDIGYPAKIVKKYNVGVVAKSFTSEALNDAVQECIANIEMLSLNCEKVIMDFDGNNYCNDLHAVFK